MSHRPLANSSSLKITAAYETTWHQHEIVPLILKMEEIIFLQANYFTGHFKGYFEGVKKVKAPSKYPEQ
jgi:hypothetical protein